MKNLKSKLLLILLPGVLFGCPSYDPQSEVIEVHNNTADAIYVYYTCNDSIRLTPELILYDTLVKNDVVWKIAPPYRVPAYTTKPAIAHIKLSDLFAQCNDSSLNIFFIKEETMKINSWSEIYEHQLYDKVIKLTYDELEKKDRLIFYSNNK